MQRTRTLTDVLRNSRRDQIHESLSWLAYNLLGSTLPIWLGGFILLPIFSRHFSLIEYSKHGELALYCAAFLAPTLRLIGRDVEDYVFVRRQLFLLFGWIALTAAVGLYSGVISAAGTPTGTIQVNSGLLFYFSLVLFIVSVVFSWLVRLIDFQRIRPAEVFAAQRSSAERLDEAFNELTPPPHVAPAEFSEEAAQHTSRGVKPEPEESVDNPGGDDAG